MDTLFAKSAGQDGSTFTKTVHKTTYPIINPARPELSQAGRTIVITGGSAGIGFAIAQGFAQAGAKHIIILGRRQNVLDEAVLQLHKEYPSVKIDGRQSDVSDLDETDALWKSFENDGIFVDVLVLNAALVSAGSPILELDKLGGHFAVWAASDEARFLHGRFVWASWDIDELRTGEIKETIENNPEFLKVGIVGLQQ